MVEPIGVATSRAMGWVAGNERASGFAGARVGVRGAKPLAAGWGSASVPPATEAGEERSPIAWLFSRKSMVEPMGVATSRAMGRGAKNNLPSPGFSAGKAWWSRWESPLRGRWGGGRRTISHRLAFQQEKHGGADGSRHFAGDGAGGEERSPIAWLFSRKSMVEPMGVATSRAMGRGAKNDLPSPGFSAGKAWWSRWESNPRPHECHSCALPTELRPHPGGKR
jgi:hypothetical protein